MREKEEHWIRHIYKLLCNWNIILDGFPCSLLTSVEVSAVFATFADLAVSAVPVGAVVGQESPGFLLYAASWDLGVAARGVGCVEVP